MGHISPFACYETPPTGETEEQARVRSFARDFGKCEWRARRAGLSLIQHNEQEYSVMGWTSDGKRKWVKRIFPRWGRISEDKRYGRGPYVSIPASNFTLPEIVGCIIAKHKRPKGPKHEQVEHVSAR